MSTRGTEAAHKLDRWFRRAILFAIPDDLLMRHDAVVIDSVDTATQSASFHWLDGTVSHTRYGFVEPAAGEVWRLETWKNGWSRLIDLWRGVAPF